MAAFGVRPCVSAALECEKLACAVPADLADEADAAEANGERVAAPDAVRDEAPDDEPEAPGADTFSSP